MELNPLIHESQSMFMSTNLTYTSPQPPPPSSSGITNLPILAIALLAIMVTAFLLISYYIIAIKCCLSWHHLQPLRRFSISFARDRGPHRRDVDQSSWQLAFSSPATDVVTHRGLDELVLRDIPTFKYKSKGSNKSTSVGERSFRGCAVCLSEFEDQELLRVLPHCGHIFHLDCIDIWLANNANCPLCRSSIVSGNSGGTKRGTLDHIVAPSSSPQEIIPSGASTTIASDLQFVVIEIDQEYSQVGLEERKRKLGRSFHHASSILGDECIDVRMKEEHHHHHQPIRRSFSMDSATDRQLLMQVQEIIRQKRLICNEATSSSNNRSVRRSFFSFGQGQGSKSAVLPIQSDP